MEYLKSCCCLLSLQVGVVVIATIFFMLSFLLLNVTILDYYESNGFPWVLIVIVIFLVLINGVAVTALIGAYFEHRKMILCALGIMSLSFLYWLIFVILTCTLATKTIPYFCISTRCAVSLWLVPLHFRSFPDRSFHSVESYEGTSTTEEPNVSEAPPNARKTNLEKVNSKREILFNFWNVSEDQNVKQGQVGALGGDKQTATRLLKENINKTKPNFVKEFYFISDDEGVEEIRFQNKIGKTIGVIYLVAVTFILYIICMVVLYSYSVQLKEEESEEEEYEMFAPIAVPRKK